ncbi:thiamine diphosphokinase [Sporomusa acidovorans]|uniref:Thiamine diphosphokinase n=1 Tax=Sporomusa acidovorans (strain ATCC 49682 / DSM 3132 / Mol) TaxID=1123286 RepID=A0ABZ3J6U2_SPOA4|nr:thiamine diphosphokinase [Sporomusa acidovorans]OZC21039.1 thiamin pyrophosphokinase, catalytic domain [Sporomusa acidovorans DSM 3132]SDF17725.1 thiamine pyrophosphokinase [Sporomusa acidovorans]
MGHSLTLPQVTLLFANLLPAATLLMTAGGRPPANKWFVKIAKGLPVWCIDSGIQICRQTAIAPERIIGDGDSASPEAWDWGKSLGVPVEVYPVDKDYTDLQLALLRTKEIFSTATVIVSGVWGGRFDHAFSNIQSLAGWESPGFKGIAADESEVLFFLSGQDAVRINAAIMPDIVSLISLSTCCLGVTIGGVRWPLEKATLKRDLPYAISNQPVSGCREVSVSVEQGLLGVYLQWHDQ